jgi:hypothetical protein
MNIESGECKLLEKDRCSCTIGLLKLKRKVYEQRKKNPHSRLTEMAFLNFQGAQESIPPAYVA